MTVLGDLIAKIDGLASRVATEFNTLRVTAVQTYGVNWVATAPVAALSGLTVNTYFTATDGDTILLRSQGQAGGTSANDNGVWTLHAGAWVRASGWGAGLTDSQLRKRRAIVMGNYQHGQEYVGIVPSGNLGSNPSYWQCTTGAGTSSPPADTLTGSGQLEYDVTHDKLVVAGFNVHMIGEVRMYAGSGTPSGWLLCDGSSVLQASYPDLFTTIGTQYGSVDGTHFTLPDFTSKFPRGNSQGTSGGADSVALPAHIHTHSHTHSVPAHAHPLFTSANATLGGSSIRNNATSTDTNNALTSGGASTANTSNPTTSPAIATVPSYTGVKFIIRAY